MRDEGTDQLKLVGVNKHATFGVAADGRVRILAGTLVAVLGRHLI